ncbi:MAG: MFS transporter [Gemmataceae bacterium]
MKRGAVMDGGQAIGIVASVGVGIVGLLATTAAHLKGSLSKQLGLGNPQITGLWSALYLALLPMLLLWGVAVDTYHVKNVMILGSLLSTLGIFGITLRRSYPYALAFIALSGIGVGALGIASLVLAARTPDAKPAAALSLSLLFLTLGMLAGPWIVRPMMRRLEFKRTLCILALLCLVPGALIAPFDIPGANAPVEEVELFESVPFWMMVFLVFLYPALEATCATWTVPYLKHLGLPDRKAFTWLAGFWIAFLAARLVLISLFQRCPEGRIDRPWVIFSMGLALAIVAGNLGGSAHRTRASFGLLLLGAALGPLLPTLLATAFRHAGPTPGTAVGTLAAAAFLGFVVLAPASDAYTRRNLPQYAWRMLALLAVIMTFLALVMALTSSAVQVRR